MSEQSLLSLFNEGQVTLPAGYQDRTVNVFTSADSQAPSFNISRDTLNAGETLAAYVDRQLALMAKHLKGWKAGERGECTLGDNLTQGEIVQASYLREGKRIWQQQAVFTTPDSRILVFTISSSAPLKDHDSTQFLSLLRSFRLHA
ncbi:DcrB-related protein [Kosakonia quasisacchari]|uniref:DcrB-related protein n=1 Tax=Kosakonia quasisacchari TaxID=2529380 RepID=UPI0039DFC05A